MASEVFDRMMSSFKEHLGFSRDHKTDNVRDEFRVVSSCIETIERVSLSLSPDATRLTPTQVLSLQDTIQQLIESVTYIQQHHPSHTTTSKKSKKASSSSTITKEEESVLSLASQIISRVFIDLANNTKVLQKFKKALDILMSLRPETRSHLEECLHTLLVPLDSRGRLSAEALTKVSSLLETSNIVRDYLMKNFALVLSSVAGTLSGEIGRRTKETDHVHSSKIPAADICYQATKVFLKICQYAKENLRPLLWQPRESTGPRSNVYEDLFQMVSGLVILIEDKRFSKDCGLMAGSTFAMMLNSAPQPKLAAQAVNTLINRYSTTGGQENLQIGNMTVPALSTALQPASAVFPQVAIARGVLTCCDKAILLEDVSRNDEQQILSTHVIFPLICDLCKEASGELKYHTSEALSLYLQVMKTLLPIIQKKNSTSPHPRLFDRDSTQTRAILKLVWREWQSPVDGVAEIIRSSLATLLVIHQEEAKSLGITDSQLAEPIISTLLSTAWHVKGRYHLMSRLVPHCNAINLLTLHPGLPRELLHCLGTNYLAAAVSELHNALVRKMGKEMMPGKESVGKRTPEEEEELTKRWGSIWEQVMLQGLCNDDGLVRYHTSNSWIQSAIKSFPGVFSLLMKSLDNEPPNDNTDVRRLHARIILLKTARCNNTLESDWLEKYMDIVSAGLWHPENDIQGDSLSLLCCSPKKSELPTPSEMLLLKRTFPHLLNSDSAKFRNCLRHNIIVFVGRLCDGGLGLLKNLRKLETKLESTVDDRCPTDEAHSTDVKMGGVKVSEKRTSQADEIREKIDVLTEKLFRAVDALDCLMEVSFGSLFPGACYQRRRVAMEILGVVFDNLMARDKLKEKNAVSGDVMTWAVDHGKCNLLSERNASILLECIQDSANDLRSSSYHLLSTYFPTALPSSASYPYTSSSEILCRALQLVSSPKLQESEAGALLSKMIFYKHSVVKTLNAHKSPPSSPVKSNGISTERGTVNFIESLLTSLIYQLKCCKKNLLQAASVTPMHGLIRAIKSCITDQPTSLQQIFISDSDGWSSLVEKLLATLQDITQFILLILSGHKKTSPVSAEKDVSGADGSSGMAPSFCQMGEAIEGLITEMAAYQINDDDDYDGAGEDKMMSLSEEHQLILACCWLNLKECSLLIGAIVETMPLSHDHDNGVLTFDQLTLMANLLVEILTRCRHKGAIDGCNQGFAKLCSRLLASQQPKLQSLPKTILDKVLGLVTNEAAESSFTKKSAGLPLLVESIVSAEPRGRERPLLAYTMDSLMKIASQPLPLDPTDKQDLPQSHALNILMELFRCSAVGTDILRHCSEAVKLAIGGFASPCWTIRNGSMRLFGTLTNRIFGQKKVQDEHSQVNAMSAATFFRSYPDLQEFLLNEVGKFDTSVRKEQSIDVEDMGEENANVGQPITTGRSGEGKSEDKNGFKDVQEEMRQGCDIGRLFLHPSLHPVLTLLSKLGPGVGNEDNELLSAFLEPVRRLASSPIYPVRELAARSLVPLIPQSQMSNQMIEIIDNLPIEAGAVRAFNRLHGDLLQLEKLFEAAVQNRSIQKEDLITIQAKLAARTWIAGFTNPCALIRAVFVNLTMAVISECEKTCADSGATQLLSDMSNTATEYFEGIQPFQVGLATLNRVMTTARLTFSSLTSKPLTPSLATTAQMLLTSKDLDIKLATLDYLQSCGLEFLQTGAVSRLIEELTNLITNSELESRCLEKALTLWVDLKNGEDKEEISSCDWSPLWETLTRLVDGERGSGLCGAALPAIGQMLLCHMQSNTDSWQFIGQWCAWMVRYSDPSQSETIRLAVVKSVRIAAALVWRKIAEEHTEDRLETSLDLMNVVLCLLQDEAQGIRLAAARFVSQRLPRGASCPQFKLLHSNAAQQVLINYICTMFSWSSRFMSLALCLLLGSLDVYGTVNQQHSSTCGTHLFDQESPNIYAEGVMEARILYAEIVDLVEKRQRDEDFKKWLSGWYEGFSQLKQSLEELDETRDMLKSCSIAFGGTFYGLSGHSKPFQAICRQLLYLQVLCTVAKKANKEEETESLKSEIRKSAQQMMELAPVHPCLKMELSSLIRLIEN
ncbi:tRNA (32-2'-O)-methyltransferase regulator THADA-like [Asterias amurensis]|uniref:tRNA (32-2'-O)-methyltransferase regulator THADA-like n=1 Tax=Asterias amurensis TaxID=7602 RepID=UPI003AB20CC0